MRIKKNCTRNEDFEVQTERLTKMFMEKGYQAEFLEMEKGRIRPAPNLRDK